MSQILRYFIVGENSSIHEVCQKSFCHSLKPTIFHFSLVNTYYRGYIFIGLMPLQIFLPQKINIVKIFCRDNFDPNVISNIIQLSLVNEVALTSKFS